MKTIVRSLPDNSQMCRGPVNLILIGFMGAGKSSVGRYCANVLGYKFRDTDKYIEIHSGLRISEIFASCGEVGFRERERRAVAALVRYRGLVIATGGGVVLDPMNVSVLRENGIVVWLRTPPEEVLRRTEGRSHRPLLEGVPDKGEHIRNLMSARDHYYSEAAHATVDSTGENVETVGDQVLELYHDLCAKRSPVQLEA